MNHIRIPDWQSRGRRFEPDLLHGETSSKNERYSDLYKDNIGDGGVHENPIFYGNQVQIKVAEKEALYRYFLLHGHLPPGNKIFR